MIGIVEGTVFVILLGKVIKNHLSSVAIKPVAPVAGSSVVKNHARQSTDNVSGLGEKVDFYA